MRGPYRFRAGRLDRLITIERKGADILDTAGNPTEVWSTLGPFRAELVREKSGDSATTETVREGGAVNDIQTVFSFRTRWISGLTVVDRLQFEGRAFDIIGLVEIGRRRGWEIKARHRGL